MLCTVVVCKWGVFLLGYVFEVFCLRFEVFGFWFSLRMAGARPAATLLYDTRFYFDTTTRL